VLKSASAIYRLGVDLPKTVPPDGNYKVAVTVKRPGVTVLAARYAGPPAPTSAITTDDRVRIDAPAVAPTRAVAPNAAVAAILASAAAYLASYEHAFSVVVSEETYLQEQHLDARLSTRAINTAQEPPTDRTRTLRSDVLQASVGEREWVAFRDVYEVDGQTVRDRDERLQKLFIETPAQAVEQARRIVAESARYNLGTLQRDFNVPTMALTYLRGPNQSRSEFKIAGRKDVDGVSAVVLEFKERATPTMIQSAGADLPATGRFGIDAKSGRVLKTEFSVADRRAGGTITVTYGAVPTLTVWVPILMTEAYTGAETIFAKATYSNFRQFGVSVGQIIK
jgi:hypothetical protein